MPAIPMSTKIQMIQVIHVNHVILVVKDAIGLEAVVVLTVLHQNTLSLRLLGSVVIVILLVLHALQVGVQIVIPAKPHLLSKFTSIME